jgi:hypothetical protein
MSKEQSPRGSKPSSDAEEQAPQETSLREWRRGFLLDQLIGTVFGPFIRLIAAVFLGVGGMFLVIAWQVAPQKAVDAARYAKYTTQVQGRIVESWLAVEVDTAQIRVAKNWRASSRATPCAVVEYEGEWGPPARRAFCGSRLMFTTNYTLHDLNELTSHVPFIWARDASGFIVPEIRIGARASEWLATHGFNTFMHDKWPVKSALDELRIELDHPVDDAVAGWIAPAAMMPLAFDPQRPAEALPTGFVAAHVHWQPAMLILAGVIGVLGLAVWFEGMTVLLGENVPLPARVFIAVLPLLALPWWGDYFPRTLSHLNAQWASVISDILGESERVDRLVASDPVDATLADGERLIWRAGDGVYKETFGRIRFTPPNPAPSSADAALAALADTVTAQTRALSVDERTAMFARLKVDKLHDLRAAGIVFLPAAKEAVLDPRSDPALWRVAATFLVEWLNQPMDAPRPRDLGYQERGRLLGALADIPIPEISISASEFVERAEKKQ